MKTQESQEFHVFMNQVNRQVVTVKAKSEEEAKEKAYRKWRREFAHTSIDAVEKVEDE